MKTRPHLTSMSRIGLLLSLSAGVALGLGGFTFNYAEGTSYLSDDPGGCVNCHVMRDVYEGWLRSSHHAVATCNDCHVPQKFVGKWSSKMINGFNHSWAFTSGNFPDPIRITPRNARILEENCIACHAEVVSVVLPPERAGRQGRCVSCHRGVGHGP